MINLSQITIQLEREKKRLTSQLGLVDAALEALGKSSGKKRVFRKISAAGRERIAAAQIARWAKVRAAKRNVVRMPTKRTLSPAGRAKIAAAQRARWAKAKAQTRAA